MNYNDQKVDSGRQQYYSSSKGPFHNVNNIFMFYGGGDRGSIVECITRAVENRECVIHVHGEPGSGKTMLSLVISDRLKHRYHTMRYDLPDISSAKLLRHLLIELAPQDSDLISSEQAQTNADLSSIHKALRCVEVQLSKVFLAHHDKPYILFIDSKGSLDSETLFVIERLCAFRIDDEPVFNCVVLHTSAKDAERYAAVSDMPYQSENHFWLRRLTLAEVGEYLRHHMMLFDFNRRDLFTQEMVYMIANRSEGVFKSINAIARNVLDVADMDDMEPLGDMPPLVAKFLLSEESTEAKSFLRKHVGATVGLLSFWFMVLLVMVLYFM